MDKERLYRDLKPITLIKMLIGDKHMDFYYDEWINKKMVSFDTFWGSMDKKLKIKYLKLNKKYNL